MRNPIACRRPGAGIDWRRSCAAVLGATAWLGVACPAVAAGAGVGAPAAQAAQAATLIEAAPPTTPWWQGFRDPVLTQLIGPAPDDARAANTAQAWIAAQVFHVQSATAVEIGRTARVEQRMLMNTPADTPGRDALLAQLASRVEVAENVAQERRDRRNEQLERIGNLCAMTPQALIELVQPRLQALALPQFDAEAPPAGSAPDATLAGEIRRLLEQQQRAASALLQAHALQVEYQTLKARDPQEPEAQLAVLQSYERLLLQGQQVAAASGELAMAWLNLLQAHGGHLSAVSR